MQVRARGASKGNFVHMVLGRLSWPAGGDVAANLDADTPAPLGDDHGNHGATTAPGGRFCLCVGDDVSDEDMFIAAKVRLHPFPRGQNSVGLYKFALSTSIGLVSFALR